MRTRRETVEHPFGTLKMRMGATHFLMKTLPKVATEIVLAYNLTRVMNIFGIKPLLAAIRARGAYPGARCETVKVAQHGAEVAPGLTPLDTAKIGSAGRLEVHRARLLAVIGVQKTSHGLGLFQKSGPHQSEVRSSLDSGNAANTGILHNTLTLSGRCDVHRGPLPRLQSTRTWMALETLDLSGGSASTVTESARLPAQAASWRRQGRAASRRAALQSFPGRFASAPSW